MKIAFALYDGFSALEFSAIYEPLTQPGVAWQVCARTTDVYDSRGLHFSPTSVCPSLAGFDLVLVPGGPGALDRLENASLLAWLATAAGANSLAASGEGVLLLGAAGLLKERHVAGDTPWAKRLQAFGAQVVDQPVVIDGTLITAAGPASARVMAQAVYQAQGIPSAMAFSNAHAQAEEQPIPVTGLPETPTRRATINRQTGETSVEIRLDVDGSGRRQIDTGVPFLDHMLAQVAVHGLFDLYVQASGDLEIDPHHTVEDVALTLGAAFQQALGDRAGMVRTASAECPMDESLAWAAIDFSGRPYTVFQAQWHGPDVGGIPVSLIQHFFESFAVSARCTLHAAVRYGRDNHHQAEALFKALARALCAASRVDPRRAGQVPSSKGILF
jgi:imidazoleglycerol-phosphate dehydratase